MTLEESAALIQNPQLRGRIKVACLNYASRVLSSSGNSNALIRWAQQVYLSPDAAALSAQPATVMEPGVQSQGADIDDGGLQFSVENAINKIL